MAIVNRSMTKKDFVLSASASTTTIFEGSGMSAGQAAARVSIPTEASDRGLTVPVLH